MLSDRHQNSYGLNQDSRVSKFVVSFPLHQPQIFRQEDPAKKNPQLIGIPISRMSGNKVAIVSAKLGVMYIPLTQTSVH